MRFPAFKRLAAFFVLALFVILPFYLLRAQPTVTKEVQVPVIEKFGGRSFGCRTGVEANALIDEKTFDQIISQKGCENLGKLINVNFQIESLITYRVGGDCMVSADAKVFRSDAAKKYTVRIRNLWGGCRAGGSYQGWLVTEKIRAGYTVEFSETRGEIYTDWKEKDVMRLFTPESAEKLETRAIDLKGCIRIYGQNQFVIKDNETYLKEMRDDMSRDRCLKNLEKIDFDKHTLLGIDINSGYCGIPAGLRYETVKDTENKQYLFNISYIDPRGQVCRAMSEYDLWALVPKLPAGYEVKFQVVAVQPEDFDKTSVAEINLAGIGRIAPKGRVQDKDYNQLPVVEQLTALGKQSIPFLIGKLDDETKIKNHVLDYWSEVRVGDVALIILTDFFMDKDKKTSAIADFEWDKFLQRGNNREITGEQVLRNYIKKYGRKKIKQRWQEIWNKHQAQIYWDENERAFKIAKRPNKVVSWFYSVDSHARLRRGWID